jgi:hypothetical protein
MLEGELDAVRGLSGLRTQTFGLHYASGKEGALEAALHALCADTEAAVRAGCEVSGLGSSRLRFVRQGMCVFRQWVMAEAIKK